MQYKKVNRFWFTCSSNQSIWVQCNRTVRVVFNSLIKDAHKLGMFVHPYTFRVDDFSGFGSFKHMVKAILFEAKADGGFTDFPDIMRNLSTDQPSFE